jgi:hypothetical protein
LFWLNLGIKLTLIGLLVFAVARQDLPQFHGKAMTGRALTYPLSMIIVPLAWWLMRGSRSSAYPYALDILLVLPFLIDTGGNALNLYDTISWWDDFNHFLNWAILAGACGQFLVRLPVGRLATAGIIAGFGAISAILWEIAEYITFVRDSPELTTAYTDTLGDLGLGLAGSVLAAILTWIIWPRLHPSPARPLSLSPDMASG